jgi:hypothetical protein
MNNEDRTAGVSGGREVDVRWVQLRQKRPDGLSLEWAAASLSRGRWRVSSRHSLPFQSGTGDTMQVPGPRIPGRTRADGREVRAADQKLSASPEVGLASTTGPSATVALGVLKGVVGRFQAG